MKIKGYAKLGGGGGEQGVLWEMYKWRFAFLKNDLVALAVVVVVD